MTQNMFQSDSTNVIIRTFKARSKLNSTSTPPTKHLPTFLQPDMGIIVSCFAYGANEIKERRDYKKKGIRIQNSGNETLPQSQILASSTQHDAQQGLQDEHLATIPPANHTTAPELAGAAVVTRTVATEAPAPIPGGATA